VQSECKFGEKDLASLKLTKGELTYRSDFIEVLKDVLRPKNLEVKDEIRITLIGTEQKILIPDLLVLENGKYEEQDDTLLIKPDGLKAIVETKNPRQYSTVGFNKLIEYCRVLNHDLGFVTNFKDAIEYRTKVLPDERPLVVPKSFGISPSKMKLREIAVYILNEIETKIPEVKEISDEELVKLLQSAVDDIEGHFADNVLPIADTLGIFQISYDRDLFKPEERS
jgi:hypothetical protein